MKTAIITFFDSHPPKTGSGTVCTDFFNSWPLSKKKLFQFSKKKSKKKNIDTTSIFVNNAFFKLLNLPILLFKIIKYLNGKGKKIAIIEGPSWIFYSFFIIFFLKLYFKDLFLIYRSHSIEYEIRKKNSNLVITLLTKYLENYVVNKSNIATSVSVIEQKKFYNYYNCKTYLFPNSLDFKRLKRIKPKKIKFIPKKFIIFSGSYDYTPNKKAIDFIINKILPNLKKQNIKLVLTGNHIKKFDNQNVYNLGFVSINELKYLQKKSICLFVPIFEGYGTRIKILESLIWGNRIISTSKGIEGIDFLNNKNVLVCNKIPNMIQKIIKFSELNKDLDCKYKNIKNFSMVENSKKLLMSFLNKNDF